MTIKNKVKKLSDKCELRYLISVAGIFLIFFLSKYDNNKILREK